MLLLLCKETHWSCYKMVVQGSIMSLLEVVVENGHRSDDLLSLDGVGSDEHQFGLHVEAPPGNMVLDNQLAQELLLYSPMAVDESMRYSRAIVNNDFNVDLFE